MKLANKDISFIELSNQKDFTYSTYMLDLHYKLLIKYYYKINVLLLLFTKKKLILLCTHVYSYLNVALHIDKNNIKLFVNI